MEHAKKFCWIEYSFGSSKNRGNLFRAREIWQISLNDGFEGPAFHSSFFFSDEIKAYVAEHSESDDNGNERKSLRGYRGVHWAPFFTIDVDSYRECLEWTWSDQKKRYIKRPESERDEWRKAHENDPPVDPDFARKDALEVLRCLRDEFGVDPNRVLICFTGNKGFHLKVPTAYFQPEPCDNFAQRIRMIVERCIWPKIDTKVFPHPEGCIDWQIYNHLHVIRAINSVHEKSKLFKIPLTHDELGSVSMADLRRLAEGPRAPWKKPRWDDIVPSKAMQDAWVASEAWTKERAEKFATEGRIHHRLDLIVKGEARPPRRRLCAMKLLGEDVGAGNRNPTMLMVASDLRDLGFAPEQTFNVMRPWLKLQQGTHKTEEDLLTQVRYVYSPAFNWGCSHPVAMANCFMECYLYPQAKQERSMIEEWHSIDEYLMKLYERLKRPRYYRFPYGRLSEDVRVWGKQVFLLLGETATGKTALAMDFLRTNSGIVSQMKNADPEFNAGLGFFSLEMPGEEIAERGAQNALKMDQKTIELVLQSHMEKQKVGQSNPVFTQLRSQLSSLYSEVAFFDHTAPDIHGLAKLCEAVKKERGTNLFVVDFIDRMKSRGISAYERLAPIATGLKDVVKDLDLTIVMLAQVGRDSSKMGVSMRSARGSGQLEENVDGVVALTRGTKESVKSAVGLDLPDDEFEKTKPYRYVIASAEKNRSGPEKAACLLKFYGATMSFETVDTADTGPDIMDVPL